MKMVGFQVISCPGSLPYVSPIAPLALYSSRLRQSPTAAMCPPPIRGQSRRGLSTAETKVRFVCFPFAVPAGGGAKLRKVAIAALAARATLWRAGGECLLDVVSGHSRTGQALSAGRLDALDEEVDVAAGHP
jgi:hypothetical protein